jgi:tRNA dimethylallyltransferase
MNPLLIICGPTATGKTALAIKLAQLVNGELISADSRQIYKDMDIRTGKDLGEKKIISGSEFTTKIKNKSYNLFAYDISGVPIWMYDVDYPHAEFSVSHYRNLTNQVIDNIYQRNKLPILVGGTGLYIKSIISNIDSIDIPQNIKLRQKYNSYSVSELVSELNKIDTQIYSGMNKSDQANPRRLIRKIEIALSTKTIDSAINPRKFDVLNIGLITDFSDLYPKIDARVEARINAGMEAEIYFLADKYPTWDLPALSGMGYRQWRDWVMLPENRNAQLKSKIISDWKFAEHTYARRQMTWFKKQPGINWFDIKSDNYIKHVTEKVGKWYTNK